mgnify:FL=1
MPNHPMPVVLRALIVSLAESGVAVDEIPALLASLGHAPRRKRSIWSVLREEGVHLADRTLSTDWLDIAVELVVFRLGHQLGWRKVKPVVEAALHTAVTKRAVLDSLQRVNAEAFEARR